MLRFMVLAIWMPLAALAQTYPAPLSDTVSDYADLMPPEAEARVSATLQAARTETGVHIAVATIGRQADYGGTARFADFATGWFNAWGVGDDKRDDGILILVGRADREMRIVLGDAYGPVWDGRAQRVIDTAMLPEFREDRYGAGIEAGVTMAVEQLARPFVAKLAVTEDSGFPAKDKGDLGLFAALVALGGGIIAFGGRIGRWIGAQRLRMAKCPSCHARGMTRRRDIIAPADQTTEGRGVEHLRCTSCGHERETPFVIPHRSTRRSSSSGFGGGRSSGGGASGKW